MTAQREGIGILTLNRPDKRNALSIQMRQEISKCLMEWKASKDIRAVIFTGTAPAFCAGFDLNEFSRTELIDEIIASSAKYHRDIWYFPKPTIAAINGPAMGGGFDLATICDIRIGSETAILAIQKSNLVRLHYLHPCDGLLEMDERETSV